MVYRISSQPISKRYTCPTGNIYELIETKRDFAIGDIIIPVVVRVRPDTRKNFALAFVRTLDERVSYLDTRPSAVHPYEGARAWPIRDALQDQAAIDQELRRHYSHDTFSVPKGQPASMISSFKYTILKESLNIYGNTTAAAKALGIEKTLFEHELKNARRLANKEKVNVEITLSSYQDMLHQLSQDSAINEASRQKMRESPQRTLDVPIMDYQSMIRWVEQRLITEAIEKTRTEKGVSYTLAAKLLGITRQTLDYKIRYRNGVAKVDAPTTTVFILDMPLTGQIEHVERELLTLALEKNAWNIRNAAKELQIPKNTLKGKMKKYSL
ncbi:hypothetical protein HY489_04345 [Candidatus Woesearchaeota archaeon]|nr:hypothetical protein [Candidatus Woesearchaeota archaeon]